MKSLTPRLASEFAEIVYQVMDAGPSQFVRLEASPRLGQSFDLSLNNGPVMGESGGVFGFFQKTTGFAMVSRGKANYEGHHVLAFRGTKSGHDWLTNGNVGYSTSSGGTQVHAGFNEAFESMKPALDKLLSPYIRRTAPAGIHCVGHSLGGALASLAAEWIKHNYKQSVKLYTFGAPRVGLNSFALGSTHGAAALFRCTHGADPVPNVPLWPFVHAPVNGIEYRLDKSKGIDPGAHGMGRKANPGYRNTTDTDD
ncbi:lipase family protein [Marinobacter segnicrescens]|uniref:lipase family protein n=1 Tax=Marinobacter segnicrescens TaxID=430453 RepID=UPI003A947F64